MLTWGGGESTKIATAGLLTWPPPLVLTAPSLMLPCVAATQSAQAPSYTFAFYTAETFIHALITSYFNYNSILFSNLYKYSFILYIIDIQKVTAKISFLVSCFWTCHFCLCISSLAFSFLLLQAKSTRLHFQDHGQFYHSPCLSSHSILRGGFPLPITLLCYLPSCQLLHYQTGILCSFSPALELLPMKIYRITSLFSFKTFLQFLGFFAMMLTWWWLIRRCDEPIAHLTDQYSPIVSLNSLSAHIREK